MTHDSPTGNAPRLPTVFVLISEDFFQERVCAVLRALRKSPLVPAWGAELSQSLAEQPSLGGVVDLEIPEIDALSLLRQLMADERARSLTWICYCSLEANGIQAAAVEMGFRVIPRSTMAAEMVKILQGFGPPEIAKE